ncbi:hypothetical protein MT325_m834L [Paramecium bursaria chlorella virus MT325]|uniref:Uncharacterized protein m834L n=1 Tax=Paramecium bursaria Chlorella virus MT325 TaxID=346932 RepID=A7IVL4_PBCVM|nr:hypothetical protein MT325_m834L [Paramecium bursaria chlorella virus MT325]
MITTSALRRWSCVCCPGGFFETTSGLSSRWVPQASDPCCPSCWLATGGMRRRSWYLFCPRWIARSSRPWRCLSAANSHAT